MNAEIITVGTELLLGDIVNTNSQFLSQELASFGINLLYHSTVGDNPHRLTEELQKAMNRSNLILITGGLGPTPDDLTRETVSKYLNMPMKLHEESWQRIVEYFKTTGKEMVDSNRKQAILPDPCVVFPNDHGTAPGCAVERYGQCIIMLPGPPRELIPMFNEYVCPYLSKYGDGVVFSRTVGVCGIPESAIAERIADLLYEENPTVAPYAKNGEVVLRVTAHADSREKAEAMCAPIVEDLCNRLGTNVYGVDCGSLQKRVVNLLKEKSLKIATAESCTAGLLSGRLTEVPGASDVFECGVAAYSCDIKHHVLGVPTDLLDELGAVSAPVACAMAVGVQRLSHANIGIGITGVAGPEPSEDKPVGTVFIALADEKRTWVKQITGANAVHDREYIRALATMQALDLARRYIEALPAVMAGGEMIQQPTKRKKKKIPTAEPSAGKAFHISTLLPWKGENTGIKVRKWCIWILTILLIATLIFSLVAPFEKLFPNKEAFQPQTDSVLDTNTNYIGNAITNKNMLSQFASLYKSNSDVRGWINIPYTDISYPVMQNTSTDDFYGSHNFDKQLSDGGLPYFDKQVSVISQNSLQSNLVIYGSAPDSGKGFAPLLKYRDMTYFSRHLKMEMNTLYKERNWEAFALLSLSKKDQKAFNYQQCFFEDKDSFSSFLSEIRSRSLFHVNLDVTGDDQLLTLAVNIPGKDDKLVIVARAVRNNEEIPDLKVTENKKSSATTASGSSTGSKSTTQSGSTSHGGKTTGTSTGSTTSSGASGETGGSLLDKPSVPQISGTSSSSIKESEFLAPLKVQDTRGNVYTLKSASQLQILVAGMVKNEMGQASTFTNSTEAMKAQAVASYTFLLNQGYSMSSYKPSTTSINLANSADKTIYNAVGDVLGYKMAYKNKTSITSMIPYTSYFKTSAGITANNKYVFGASLPHLQSVDSSIETASLSQKYLKETGNITSNYIVTKPDCTSKLSSTFADKTGNVSKKIYYSSGDTLQVTDKESGYQGKSAYVTKTNAYYLNAAGNKVYLTGRDIRTAFNLKSHAFTISDEGNSLKITTHGEGHGVGMSQLGAILYANEKNWSWQQILKHYYSITSSSSVQIFAPNW